MKTKKKGVNMYSMTERNPHMRWTYYRRRALVVLIPLTIGLLVHRATQPTYKCDGTVSVRAAAGDSLWSIVDDHCTGNINEAVDNAFVKNGSKFTITIGQEVFLPGKGK